MVFPAVKISKSFPSSRRHFFLWIIVLPSPLPTLSSLLVTVFSLFCFPKMKKTKRRLTVDPFDFELGGDFLMESRGRPNQVEAGRAQNQLPPNSSATPSYKSPFVRLDFSCSAGSSLTEDFNQMPNVDSSGKKPSRS